MGYKVEIFANPEKKHEDESSSKVTYHPYSGFEEFAKANTIDYCIASRVVTPFKKPIKAKKKIVWIHDVFLSRDKSFDCALSEVDHYFCLSHWHKQLVHTHHAIPQEKILVTANGVDPSRYSMGRVRTPFQAFYSSSPDRGLDTLLDCCDVIHKMVPEFTLVIAYGFNNWEKAVVLRGDKQEMEYMERIKKSLNRPYVRYIGRVDQQTLAKVQMESRVWLYPTRFHETFCITAVEAGFARCPILSSSLAGLTSTVKEGGILLKGDAYTKEYRKEFVTHALRLLHDDHYHSYFANSANKRMARFTWDAVAKQWDQFFKREAFEELQ